MKYYFDIPQKKNDGIITFITLEFDSPELRDQYITYYISIAFRSNPETIRHHKGSINHQLFDMSEEIMLSDS